MTEYVAIFGWLILWVFISTSFQPFHYEEVLGRKKLCCNWWYVILSVLPLIYYAGYRSASFGDTGVYMETYKALPASFSEMYEYVMEMDKDKGFYLFSGLIKLFQKADTRIYFLILAAIQALLLAGMFRKYSTDYLMSLFIFVASTDYLSWMHNGIRQFTAVTIILAATGLLLHKKFIPLVLIILAASTFHQSALLMIPIIFIVQGKAWNKKTVLAVLVMLMAIVFVDRFTNILDSMLQETQYSNAVSDWQSWDDDGTNPLRVLIYSVPALMSLWGLKYIRQENDPVINVCCNMAAITMGLYGVSMVTSGIMIGRLPIYTSLYATGILLPWEIDNIFAKGTAQILRILLILCYLVFYYYQLHYAWGML